MNSIFEFLAPTPIQLAQFGDAISVDGDRVAIAAPYEPMPNSQEGESGAVYIFVRSGTGWAFEKKLTGTGGYSYYGQSLALRGDTLVVGAPAEKVAGVGSVGGAYIYVRENNDWVLQLKLPVPAPSFTGQFGKSVALHGDTLAISAYPNSNVGTIYVYRRVGSSWTSEAVVRDETGTPAFGFGLNIDLHGDTLVAGERAANSQNGTRGGAVCVFVRSGTTWTLQTKILSPFQNAVNSFGSSVSILNDSLLVGDESDQSWSMDLHHGSVYAFNRSGAVWAQTQKLSGFGAEASRTFGAAVAQSNDRMVVGAYHSLVGNQDPGVSFYFRRNAQQEWEPGARLVAPDTASNNLNGYRVAISGNQYFSTNPWKRLPGINQAGMVNVFAEASGVPDLSSASDSGVSDSDNNTNAQNLSFAIRNVTPGATVELLRNGVAVRNVVAISGDVSLIDEAVPQGNAYSYASRQTVNGQISSLSDPLIVTVDRTAPTVAIEQYDLPGTTRETSVMLWLVINEPSFGVDGTDISLEGSTANVQNATVVVDPPVNPQTLRINGIVSDGQFVRATMAAGKFTDAAGNLNTASTSTDNTVIVDNVRPSVTINQAAAQADPVRAMPIRYDVVFNEAVTGFTASDVSLSGSTANTFGNQITVSGSGANYTVEVRNITSNGGILRASIGQAAAVDSLQNFNFASTSTDNSVTVDNVGPSVTVSQAPGQSDPANSQPVRFRVVFNEPVTGFGVEDLSYVGSTVVVSGLTAAVSGSGTTYDVEVSSQTYGRLQLSVNAGAAIDALENPSLASTAGDNVVTLIAPFATVSGRISTAQGRGLAGVRVVATLPGGGERTVRTNSFGYYALRNIPTGNVTLTFTRKSAVGAIRSVQLTADLPNYNLEFN